MNAPTKKIGNIEVLSLDLIDMNEMAYSRDRAEAAIHEMNITQHFAVDVPGRGRTESLTAEFNGQTITYIWASNGTKSQQKEITLAQAQAQVEILRQMGLIS